jgi:O-antigen ligase
MKAVEALKRVAPLLDARALPIIADGLVIAIAALLPWSTSATAILIVLWLIALVPTLDRNCVRREALLAGGLPILLWLLAAGGMLWADVSLTERLQGLNSFHKLLFVPLLLAQFYRGGRARWVIVAFLASCGVLLVLSLGLALLPGLSWRGKDKMLGVPVKDYILQSELFVICAFGLLGQAAAIRRARPQLALLLALAAALFIGDLLYVETARTALVIMAVLLCLLGMRQFGWKGALVACAIGALLAAAAWMTSPHLRERMSRVLDNVEAYKAGNINTPIGQRFEYWSKSLKFVEQAPVLGHGTGSVLTLFRRDATPLTHPSAITGNPHNQLLVVAIELGIVGSMVLCAMWASHLALFREHTLFAWFGLIVVVQNIVACLFNSHLFDFAQGWLYVFGVGVLGGTVLRDRLARARPDSGRACTRSAVPAAM